MEEIFTQADLEAVARALADTNDGLTGAEIGYILPCVKMDDLDQSLTKWKRLYNSFVRRQNASKNRRAILEFIRLAMHPQKHLRKPERFEKLRKNLNSALAFSGLFVDETGVLKRIDKARTIEEAQKIAKEMRSDLIKRGVHEDVLQFCSAELLKDDYFHGVLEAVKSIAHKMREKTGLKDDGAVLVDKALAGAKPILAINPLVSENHESEQKGFGNLVKGVFGMFRNPTAHEARILWPMTKEDAEDLFSIASLIHRRLDSAKLLK